MTWKFATCEACAYRVNEACRRFPQYKQVEFSSGYYDTSSMVASIDRAYSEACAEYIEEGQLPLKQIGDIPTAPFTTYDVAEEAWKESR